MVGLIAVISCSFIVGDRKALSDRKYLNRDLKEVREQPGHLREEF